MGVRNVNMDIDLYTLRLLILLKLAPNFEIVSQEMQAQFSLVLVCVVLDIDAST